MPKLGSVLNLSTCIAFMRHPCFAAYSFSFSFFFSLLLLWCIMFAFGSLVSSQSWKDAWDLADMQPPILTYCFPTTSWNIPQSVQPQFFPFSPYEVTHSLNFTHCAKRAVDCYARRRTEQAFNKHVPLRHFKRGLFFFDEERRHEPELLSNFFWGIQAEWIWWSHGEVTERVGK